MVTNPEPSDVVSLRTALQDIMGCGITAAQDTCAELLHTSRRAWQQWERGDRKMHPAFWELINIKYEKYRAKTNRTHS